MNPFDVIVIGAGAAGCVMASRLSQDRARRVLLVEAGIDLPPGREPGIVRDTYPRSYGEPAFMWPGLQAQAGAGDPPRFFEQACVMGGGSSIMGMAALRGLPSDFQSWTARGLEHWGWEDVLPFYRQLERDLDFGETAAHGGQGPIPVRRHREPDWPPFCAGIARSLHGRGWSRIEDLNADFRDGIGPVPMSNLPSQRVSASMAYLGPEVRARPNLRIQTRSRVLRLLADGVVITGIELASNGHLQRLHADEVIVCAGAIHTPALLLRSGIGCARELEPLGIRVRADRPGVGRNLQNHPLLQVAAILAPAARQPRGQRPWPQNALRFSSGLTGIPSGDLFMLALNKTSWHALGARLAALTVSVYTSYSRGDVTLASADPMTLPRVRFALLSDARDRQRLAQGLQLAVELMHEARRDGLVQEVFVPTAGTLIRRLNRPRWSSAVQARAIALAMDAAPGWRRPLVSRAGIDPGEVLGDAARAGDWATRWAAPAGHVCGTCRMGPVRDRDAVADEEGRVHGLRGVRIADASLMPTIVSANTHLTVTMVAEKLAAHMAGTHP